MRLSNIYNVKIEFFRLVRILIRILNRIEWQRKTKMMSQSNIALHKFKMVLNRDEVMCLLLPAAKLIFKPLPFHLLFLNSISNTKRTFFGLKFKLHVIIHISFIIEFSTFIYSSLMKNHMTKYSTHRFTLISTKK